MNLDKMQVDEFVNLLGSDAPAPGGGAAAALTGAIGVSLTEMVASLTLNNKKFEENWEEVRALKEKASELSKKFQAIMNEDARLYSDVRVAYSLPKETEEEKLTREAKIQETLKSCVKPPMNIMKVSVEALHLTKNALGKTTKSAISDLGVAASNLYAAAEGGIQNVKINTGLIKDKTLADKLDKESEELLSEARKLSKEIIEIVNE